MNKLKVSFDVVGAFDDCTDDQILEWLKYELGQLSIIDCLNPLSSHDIRGSNVSMKVIKKEG